MVDKKEAAAAAIGAAGGMVIGGPPGAAAGAALGYGAAKATDWLGNHSDDESNEQPGDESDEK